jgi:outer membrane protein assembly factor BamB
VTTLAGTKQVVSVNNDSVTGHDAETGAVLWTHEWKTFAAKCSQPVPIGDDRLFLSMGYGFGAQIITIEKKDGTWAVKPGWAKNRSMRTTFSNVVIHNGYVYGIDDGALQCIDLKTGQQKWRQSRDEACGTGQVLGVDDQLILQAENGRVYLVAADPEQYKVLGEMDALHDPTGKTDDKTWNNPALAGKYLLVRNGLQAICYELPLKGK